MITGIDLVHVVARDMTDTIDFYTNALGFYLLRRIDMGDGREIAYIGLGDTLLELVTPNDRRPAPTDGQRGPLGLAVSDLDQTLADLRAKGVRVEADYSGRTFTGRQVDIKDPSGYIITLREWHAPDGHHNFAWQSSQSGIVRIA